MGASCTTMTSAEKRAFRTEKFIDDNYNTYDELEQGLRKAGLEACELIVGIDFTKSNEWQGGEPYYINKNLHSISPYPNPYQRVLEIMCKTLAHFDDDGFIPAYGFGDSRTKDKSVFPFLIDNFGHDMPCVGLDGILQVYNQIVMDIHNQFVQMSGPTTFVPLINKAIEIVKATKSYHILLIICDGCVNDVRGTTDAIIAASEYPLSIICVGVGRGDNGSFGIMETFDDDIPDRAFDNFQFVNFHKKMRQCENQETEFAKHALMEIPEQYDYIKRHLLFK